MSKRTEFKVTWTIEVDAETAEEAAQDVHDTYFRKGNDATVFEVQATACPSAAVKVIDVADLQEDE